VKAGNFRPELWEAQRFHALDEFVVDHLKLIRLPMGPDLATFSACAILSGATEAGDRSPI